jgi:hypothetical protein
MSNTRRHGGVQGIVPQHLLHVRKLERRSLLVLLLSRLLLLLLAGRKFILMFHGLSALLKQKGESFSRAVQFSPHRIRGLLGQYSDLFVTQLFVRHEQQQKPILAG